MATTARAGTARPHDHDRGRTPAQWYCTLAGAALLLVGILGFLVDATFDTGSGPDSAGGNSGGGLQGDSLLGFEVNGWHNVVHILSGIVLLAASKKRVSAKSVAIGFGVVYGLVAVIGLIDGNDVLGIIPVNPADNVLHIALSLVGILAGIASDADDRGGDRVRGSESGPGTTSGRTNTGDRERITRDVDPLTGAAREPQTAAGGRVGRTTTNSEER